MSAPGPVRNVRVMVKAPKKRCGYGLYYSDSDEEDENLSDSKSQLQQQIVSQPSVASPTVISRPTTTTTATAKTSEKVPDYIVSTRRRKVSSSAVKQTNVSGAKTLMIERGSTNNADLYQAPAPARGVSRPPLPRHTAPSSQSLTSGSRSRSSRTSPYGKTSPVTGRQKVRNVNCELDSGDIEHTYIDSSLKSVDASKYTMKDGLVFPGENTKQVTPKTSAPKTPARSDKTSPGGRATWGGWLKSLMPESVKEVAVNRSAELVEDMDMDMDMGMSSVLVPSPNPSSPSGPLEVQEPYEKGLRIPGRFDEKPLVEEEKPIVEKKPIVRKRSRYINPLTMEVYTRPPPSNSPFWPFDDSIYTTGKYRARPPVRTNSQSASANVVARGRGQPPPSIQQSSVPSQGGYKRVRIALRQAGLTEEEKNRIAEERLVELEIIARDRRIEMQQDAYEKRFLLAQFWRSSNNDEDKIDVEGGHADGDSTIQDINKPAEDKNKVRETENAEEAPKSPETTRHVSKSSSFLFGGSAYDPSCAPPRPILSKPHKPRRGLPVPEAKKKKTVSLDLDSDKENLTKPPPPPTLSQAKPSNPIVPTGAALLPPPTQRSTQRPQLSPQKRASGRGSSDPAFKAQSLKEKLKPVSIGLCTSTTMRSERLPRTRATNRTISPVTRTGTFPVVPQFLPPIPKKRQQQQQSPWSEAFLDGRTLKVKQARMLSMQVDKVVSHNDSQKGIIKRGAHDGDLRAGLKLKTNEQPMLDIFTSALAPQPAQGGIFGGEEKVKQAVGDVWVTPKEEETNGIMGTIMKWMEATFFGPI